VAGIGVDRVDVRRNEPCCRLAIVRENLCDERPLVGARRKRLDERRYLAANGGCSRVHALTVVTGRNFPLRFC
jgi:hypothetical protein